MLFHPVRFCLTYVGLTALLFVIMLCLQLMFGVEIGSGSGAVVPMVAAMLEGQKFVMTSRTRPQNSLIWQAVCKMTVLVMLMSVVHGVLLYLVDPVSVSAFFSLSLAVWVIVLAVVTLIVMGVMRLGYGLGVRSGLKQLSAAG